jgi:hypothetical protein
MVFNAPSVSELRFASVSAAAHFVLKSGFCLVAFLLTLARFDVMAKVGGDAV